MPRDVIVLLSTYNGEKYIIAQLDSILNQTYQPIQIIIRDDGSTDSTVKILDEYSRKYERIRYYIGKNIKPARSFLDLLKVAPNADFYAFSDQDDVWLPNKIEVAIKKLMSANGDLYHSAFQMTDPELNYIPTPTKKTIRSLGESLVLLAATGCTMVISKKIRDLSIMYVPDFIIMHDCWLLKLTYAVGGVVVYDEEPHILYRQHENNVLGGIPKSHIKLWYGRFLALFSPRRERWCEVNELYKGYYEYFSDQTKNVIEPIVNYIGYPLYKRIILSLRGTYKTMSCSKNILFMFAIITKKY